MFPSAYLDTRFLRPGGANWRKRPPSFARARRTRLRRTHAEESRFGGTGMTITLHPDAESLRVDDSGSIRVGASRVSLDVVLADYSRGMSPDMIARELDTLRIADVR